MLGYNNIRGDRAFFPFLFPDGEYNFTGMRECIFHQAHFVSCLALHSDNTMTYVQAATTTLMPLRTSPRRSTTRKCWSSTPMPSSFSPCAMPRTGTRGMAVCVDVFYSYVNVCMILNCVGPVLNAIAHIRPATASTTPA
jgi:hypothetical protein